jgi:hypothetical protein
MPLPLLLLLLVLLLLLPLLLLSNAARRSEMPLVLTAAVAMRSSPHSAP